MDSRSKTRNQQIQDELYGEAGLRKKAFGGLVAVVVVILLFGVMSSNSHGTRNVQPPVRNTVHAAKWHQGESITLSEPTGTALSEEEDMYIDEKLDMKLMKPVNLKQQSTSSASTSKSTSATPTELSKVYLSDLGFTASYVGWGNVGLGTSLGFEGIKFKVKGVAYTKGVSLHAASSRSGPAFADFDIDGKYTKFQSAVAVNDGNNHLGRTGSPLTFVVKGDGKELWRSRPVQATGYVQEIHELSIVGVKTLTLQVFAEASNACSHSVWLDPTVFV